MQKKVIVIALQTVILTLYTSFDELHKTAPNWEQHC